MVNSDNKHKEVTAESGQGMVEFSIILIVLIALFVGTFEIMTAVSKWNDLETATRMATRQAAESWVPTGASPNIEADITDYLKEEMVKMGYSSGVIDSTVTVEVIAHEYDGGAIVPELTTKVCTYGEYISVRATMGYQPVILPLDAFFGDEDGAGTIEAQYINRCTRGQ